MIPFLIFLSSDALPAFPSLNIEDAPLPRPLLQSLRNVGSCNKTSKYLTVPLFQLAKITYRPRWVQF